MVILWKNLGRHLSNKIQTNKQTSTETVYWSTDFFVCFSSNGKKNFFKNKNRKCFLSLFLVFFPLWLSLFFLLFHYWWKPKKIQASGYRSLKKRIHSQQNFTKKKNPKRNSFFASKKQKKMINFFLLKQNLQKKIQRNRFLSFVSVIRLHTHITRFYIAFCVCACMLTEINEKKKGWMKWCWCTPLSNRNPCLIRVVHTYNTRHYYCCFPNVICSLLSFVKHLYCGFFCLFTSYSPTTVMLLHNIMDVYNECIQRKRNKKHGFLMFSLSFSFSLFITRFIANVKG